MLLEDNNCKQIYWICNFPKFNYHLKSNIKNVNLFTNESIKLLDNNIANYQFIVKGLQNFVDLYLKLFSII